VRINRYLVVDVIAVVVVVGVGVGGD